jgi:molybdopterin converting factor small subunit
VAEKTATKKPAAKKAVAKDITIKFTAMGQESTKKTVKAGFTIGDAIEKYNLGGLNVTVNGSKQDKSYVLANNDSVVAVPQVKGGC